LTEYNKYSIIIIIIIKDEV